MVSSAFLSQAQIGSLAATLRSDCKMQMGLVD